jgi:uncharacterized membrane protein YfcA
MGTALPSYVGQGVVDCWTAKFLLVGAVPAVVVGAFAARLVPDTVSKAFFGVGLLVLGGFLFF